MPPRSTVCDTKTINIAVFDDAGNTVQPEFEASYPAGQAFTAWCNASHGINGRKIVVDNRDAALFDAAQQATAACQSSSGGQRWHGPRPPSVPVREQCGLGKIVATSCPTQQNSPPIRSTPWRRHQRRRLGLVGALTKAYPQGVKKAAMGGANTSSRPRGEHKDASGAEARMESARLPGAADFVADWAPYIEQVQSKGVEALWPSLDDNIVPYFQAMTTAGYHPAFVILGVQFYNSTTTKGSPKPSLHRSTSRRHGGHSRWPRRTLDRAARQRHAHVRQERRRRLRRRGGCRVVAPVGEVRLCLWRRPDSVVRAQPRRRHEEWDAGGIEAPVAQLTMSNNNLSPHRALPCSKPSPTSSSTTRRSPSPPSPSGTATRRTSST